jgi:single-strand DNA-binding protein
MGVNKVILIGRLGRDPELKYTPNGQAVTNFTLATDRSWTGSDGQKNRVTTWHNIVAWGKQAEIIKEYMSKGREIYIEGRIDNRSYDDKEGNKRYVSEVVVESFQFIGSRGDTSGGQGQGPDMPGNQTSPADTGSGEDEDLPF